MSQRHPGVSRFAGNFTYCRAIHHRVQVLAEHIHGSDESLSKFLFNVCTAYGRQCAVGFVYAIVPINVIFIIEVGLVDQSGG